MPTFRLESSVIQNLKKLPYYMIVQVEGASVGRATSFPLLLEIESPPFENWYSPSGPDLITH